MGERVREQSRTFSWEKRGPLFLKDLDSDMKKNKFVNNLEVLVRYGAELVFFECMLK